MELGIGYGVLALLFDILKAFIATFLPHKLLHRAVEVSALSGIACILGHIFPIFMKFKGGKGVACVIGFGLALNPLLVIPVVIISMLLGWLVGASTFVPVFSSITMILYYAVFEKSLSMSLIMAMLAIILLIPRRKDIVVMFSSKNRDVRKTKWVSFRRIKENLGLLNKKNKQSTGEKENKEKK